MGDFISGGPSTFGHGTLRAEDDDGTIRRNVQQQCEGSPDGCCPFSVDQDAAAAQREAHPSHDLMSAQKHQPIQVSIVTAMSIVVLRRQSVMNFNRNTEPGQFFFKFHNSFPPSNSES